jgi:hypothetical protein
MSATVTPIRSRAKPLPVSRRYLEEVTQASVRLSGVRETLLRALKDLEIMECQVTDAKRAILGRLASGAELED